MPRTTIAAETILSLPGSENQFRALLGRAFTLVSIEPDNELGVARLVFVAVEDDDALRTAPANSHEATERRQLAAAEPDDDDLLSDEDVAALERIAASGVAFRATDPATLAAILLRMIGADVPASAYGSDVAKANAAAFSEGIVDELRELRDVAKAAGLSAGPGTAVVNLGGEPHGVVLTDDANPPDAEEARERGQ